MEGNGQDWFEGWFNSPYYHILYRDRGMDEASLFIDNLLRYLQPPAGAAFLDLACGKGRHSLYLSRKGYDVTGLDLSPESILHASMHESPRLHFYVHDMRNLFRINYYDVVLNLFTSFGYFDNPRDNQKTLIAIAKGLRPGGTLVLDFMNTPRVVRSLVAEETREVDGIRFRISRVVRDGFIIKDIRFTDKGIDHHYTERVAAITESDFRGYMEHAGLKIIDLRGDYNLGTYDARSSERMIFIARKQG